MNDDGAGAAKRGSPRAPAWALLALIVIGGAVLRLAELGRAEFIGDELDHYYAALSLSDDGAPLLPSGNEYRRGIDITRLAGVSVGLVSDPELGARLPSALFGILAIVLFAWIAWKIAGPWAAVWAALFLAIYPEAVIQSRQVRFYGYQLCYGLVAMYAGWRVLDPESGSSLSRRLGWTALVALAFAAAVRVQVTTFSVLVGWGSAVAVMAGRDLVREGRRAWGRSLPVWLTAAGLAGALGLVVLAPATVVRLAGLATHQPLWTGGGGDVRAYYWAFSGAFPVLLALAPVTFLVVAIRRPWLAVFLGLWFVVPVALHSFLLPWKAERYVFLATPALLLVSAIAAATGATALARLLEARLTSPLGRRRAAWVARTAVFLAAGFALATSPAFNRSRDLPHPHAPTDWVEAYEILRSEGLESATLGASQPLVSLFYWGRVDFVVGTDFLEAHNGEEDPGARPSEGSPDWYGGIPVLTRPESIRRRHPDAATFAIGIETNRWEHGNIAPELRSTLEAEGEELCRGACGALLLYRWSPGGADPPSGARRPDADGDPGR